MAFNLRHAVKRGRARLCNPYRMGTATHPSELRGPESGRDAADRHNQHTTKPKRSNRT